MNQGHVLGKRGPCAEFVFWDTDKVAHGVLCVEGEFQEVQEMPKALWPE